MPPAPPLPAALLLELAPPMPELDELELLDVAALEELALLDAAALEELALLALPALLEELLEVTVKPVAAEVEPAPPVPGPGGSGSTPETHWVTEIASSIDDRERID